MTSKSPVTQLLRETKFIGKFPQNLDVLLVPLDTAFNEVKHLDKDLTTKKLRTCLKEDNVIVFNNIDDWMKFKS